MSEPVLVSFPRLTDLRISSFASAGSSASTTLVAVTSSSGSSSASPTSTSSSRSSSTRTSSAPATSSSAASGGGGGGGGEDGGFFEGEATFYAPGLGSCGIDSTEDDFVAALSRVLFDSTGVANANSNPYCGRKAFIQAAGGSSKHRRWLENNTRPGFKNWEKGRSHRNMRRATLRKPLIPSRIKTHKNGSLANDYDDVPMPGITAPPDPRRMDKRQIGGGGVTITIVDRCPVCAQYDLDLSPAAYNALGDPDAGRIDIQWSWVD